MPRRFDLVRRSCRIVGSPSLPQNAALALWARHSEGALVEQSRIHHTLVGQVLDNHVDEFNLRGP